MQLMLIPKKMSVIAIIGILTLVFMVPINSEAEQVNNQAFFIRLKMLGQLSDKEREALLHDSSQYLQKIQETLLSHLGSTNKDVRCYAAYLLGEYRFPQAATSLSQVIDLKSDVRQNTREWFWDLYPAVEALIKIGNPSISAVIRNLEESDDPKVRELSLKVISYVEKDKDIAQLRLKKALEAQPDSKKKTRLEVAIRAIAASKSEK